MYNTTSYYQRFKQTLFVLFLFSAIMPAVKGQAPQRPGKLSDLSFIEGHWKATTSDRTIEGVWLAPEGDNMLGFMRMMNDKKANLYELLAYEQTEQGFVSRVKHFKPGMLGQEEKDKSDQYTFIEAANGRVVLEKEGGEMRIVYEKRGNNQFAIMRGNLLEGKWAFKDLFVFNRVK
ncbi:MAG: hypothetical protein JWQ09_340 [Segetibacter sp.]|nr:hypothetical protein [Segetibacter sp.]